MKKFLVIFGILCGLMSSANAASNKVSVKNYTKDTYTQNASITYVVEYARNDYGYGWYKLKMNNQQTRTCYAHSENPDSKADEYLYIGKWKDRAKSKNYRSTPTECSNNSVVCILGDSSSNKEGDMTDYNYKNACWTAKTDFNFEWCDEDDDNSIDNNTLQASYDCDAPYELDDCVLNPWTPQTSEKIAVFVDNDNNVIQINGGYTKSIAFWKTIQDFNVKCVAYICPDGTYGNQDGSCSQSTTTDDGDENGSGDDGDSETGGDDGGDDGDDDNGSNDQTSTPTDVKHTGTVVPYMDALKSCAGK